METSGGVINIIFEYEHRIVGVEYFVSLLRARVCAKKHINLILNLLIIYH